MADRAHPLLQAGDLDAVALVAVLLEPRLVGGYEGEALDLAAQPQVAVRRIESERDPPERTGPVGVGAPVVVEGAHPQAFGAQQVEVDVRDGRPRALGEPLGVGEQHPVLPDHRLAVPGEVGRRLALARGRVDVGREAAGRRGTDHQAPRLRATDRDRAARQVRQHRRARQRRRRTRRHRHPHVLAHLGVQDETGHVLRGEEQVGPDRDVLAEQPDRAGHVVARRDLPALVELPVGRQVRLGRHAKQLSTVDDRRHVVDAVTVPDRQPDDQDGQQVGRRRDDLAQGRLGLVEQRVLQEDVLDRVARERELRVDDEPDPLLSASPRGDQHGTRVGRWIPDGRMQGRGGDPQEPVAVEGAEVHGPRLRPLLSRGRSRWADPRSVHRQMRAVLPWRSSAAVSADQHVPSRAPVCSDSRASL